MADETFGWLFIGPIPLLFEKKRVARQVQIETWLDLTQVVKELGIENLERQPSPQPPIGYVV